MPRNKREELNKEEHFVYCGLFKCPHTQCLRHHIHEPWNVAIKERNFNPDKDWNCKDMEVG